MVKDQHHLRCLPEGIGRAVTKISYTGLQGGWGVWVKMLATKLMTCIQSPGTTGWREHVPTSCLLTSIHAL